MIESDEQGSPGWWFKVLARELHDRRLGRSGGRRWTRSTIKPARIRPSLEMLQDHLNGDPPLLGVAEGWKEHFREVVRLGRLNVASLVVEAKANRMQLRDFRTAAAGDELGDTVARDVMRANRLKLVARDVHEGMLAFGDAYAIVTPPADGQTYPLITAEDATQVITAHNPATGETLAALKMFRDDWDSADFGYLFIREGAKVTKRVAVKKGGVSSIGPTQFRMGSSWAWDEEAETEIPHGQMPVKRFRNRRGIGEFEHHLDTLDRINDQILNKLVIAKIQAFRQRAVKNLPDTETKIVDGVPVETEVDYSDAFIAAPGALWQVPGDVEFWESAPTDIGPIRLAIKDDLEHFAAVTSTPLHTITPDAMKGSAEGASLMREEHVYAVENRRDHAEPTWADVMATSFAFMEDDARSDVTKIEPIWGPVERYSLQEKADAASKAGTSLPMETIQTDIWQYPPAELANLRALRARQMLFQVAGQPAAPAAGGQPAAG